jgi:FixJ family two-component response regulator
VPVVVLTGYPDVDLEVSLMKQGVVDYLVKPVGKEKLLEVIKKTVSRHVIMKDQFAT